MRSIWHVQADTPEEMRAEFLKDLQRRIDMRNGNYCRTQRDKYANEMIQRYLKEIHRIWSEVIVDPKG
jgi:hypothetical protein